MDFLSNTLWGGSGGSMDIDLPSPSYNLGSGGLPAYESQVLGTTVTPFTPPKPNLFSAIADPWLNAGNTILKSIPDVAGTVSNSISNVLLQRAGLIPKPQATQTGTVINYEKPTVGITPSIPATVLNWLGLGGGEDGQATPLTSNTGLAAGTVVMLIAGIAVLIIVSRR